MYMAARSTTAKRLQMTELKILTVSEPVHIITKEMGNANHLHVWLTLKVPIRSALWNISSGIHGTINDKIRQL